MTTAEHQDAGENGMERDPAIQEKKALDAQTEHQITYWLNVIAPRRWKNDIQYWKRKQAVHSLLEKLHEENPELVREMAKNNYNRAATQDEQMERDRALFHAAAGTSRETRDQDERNHTADVVARLITENAREETRLVRLRAATWEKQVDYEDGIEGPSPQLEELRASTPNQHDRTVQRSKREMDRLEHIHSLSSEHSGWNERNRILEQVNGAMAEINRINSGTEYREKTEQEKQDRQKDGLTGWLKGMFRRDREGDKQEQG